ncbi:Protein abhd16a [Desmophyllum pertusum]|uniref:Protein abhd16a n=1 Tax=Desmophyllum pertusum TaxID=174260 RepID=A0A9W9YWI6_9CNID|nr:Protein abhd16a [Desmophyllum pertusum]
MDWNSVAQELYVRLVCLFIHFLANCTCSGILPLRKGLLSHAGLVSLSRFIGTGLMFVLGALCIRGYGRFKNQDYRIFLALLEETKIKQQ